MAWAAGATALAISARCRFIASLLQAGRIKAAPLPSLGRPRRRCRWKRSAGRVARWGGCHASPSGAWFCSSGRYGPHRRTRFLSRRSRCLARARPFPDAWGSFFKILNRACCLCMVTWSCREFAITHGAQLPAERLLGDRDAELLEYPLRQINQPPAHHTVHCRDRATLNHAGDGLPLSVIEF